jgi:hypothetical protein
LDIGLNIFSAFGLHFSAGKASIEHYDITLSEVAVVEGPDASFNWQDQSCLNAIKAGPLRVVGRVMKVATLAATVTTNGNQRIALDSTQLTLGELKAGPVHLTLNGGIGTPKKQGSVTAKADSEVAIARGVNAWILKTIACDGSHLALPATGGWRSPQNCPVPAADDGWYRATVRDHQGAKVTLGVQPINSGQGQRAISCEVGVEFTLDSLPQRLDRAVLNTFGTDFALTVTRLELRRQPQVLGSESPPLTRAEASAGADLSATSDE